MLIGPAKWTEINGLFYRWIDPFLGVIRIFPTEIDYHKDWKGKVDRSRGVLTTTSVIAIHFRPDGISGASEIVKTFRNEDNRMIFNLDNVYKEKLDAIIAEKEETVTRRFKAMAARMMKNPQDYYALNKELRRSEKWQG